MIHEETMGQEALFDENKKTKRRLPVRGQSKPKDKRERAPDRIADIIPIRDMDDDGVIELQGEGYMNMFQLQSKDVNAQNDEASAFDILTLAHFLRAYDPDIKIISLNFPVSMTAQIAHLQRKIHASHSPLIVKHLEKKKAELEFLEKYRTNREFYLLLYGDSMKDLSERSHFAQRKLQRVLPAMPLEKEKKLDVMYKLNNQNSKLDHQRG